MSYDNNFETADIGLAAALICCGFPIRNLNKENPKRILFVFENNEQLEDCVTEYWDEGLPIPALKIMASLRNLKTRLYARQ